MNFKIAPMIISNTSWLKALEELIVKNLDKEGLNNSWLAHQLFVSERAFYTKVKILTGISPNQFVRSVKLKKAYKLLDNREVCSVREASFTVGFRKVDYFSMLFHKQFQIHPSQVLKNSKAKNICRNVGGR